MIYNGIFGLRINFKHGLGPFASMATKTIANLTSSEAAWPHIGLHWFYAHLSDIYDLDMHAVSQCTSVDLYHQMRQWLMSWAAQHYQHQLTFL